MIITADILKQIAPGSKKSAYKFLTPLADCMNDYFPRYGIDTKAECCHFIAQAAHETDSFNSLQEYATGDAYDTRVDLGNTPEKDGDGRLYKGRGIFMVTGAANYRRATISWNESGRPHIDFMANPNLLSEPGYAVWSACDYWAHHDFNTIANMGDHVLIKVKHQKKIKYVHPVEYITLRINGGFLGLEERKGFYQKAKEVVL